MIVLLYKRNVGIAEIIRPTTNIIFPRSRSSGTAKELIALRYLVPFCKDNFVGALKTYLSIIVAIVLACGAGVAKLYKDGSIELLFWLGISVMLIAIIAFIIVSKSMHSNIKKLKDL